MNIQKEVFRAYDIRGWYGKDITADFAYALGRSVVRFMRAKRNVRLRSMVVHRDARSVSQKLYQPLIDGVISEGVNVFSGGEASSPMHYFSVGTIDVEAGIMITPSHSPAGMCGFKISTKTGRVGGADGLYDIYDDMRNLPPASGRRGSVHNVDMLDRYVAFLKPFIHVSPFAPPLHAAIDASGGAAAPILSRMLPDMHLELTRLFFDPDPDFSRHDPNPLFPESQRPLHDEMRARHYDIGALFDGDGDRILFFDERGEVIPGDVIAALIAEERLRRQNTRTTVVFDVNASRLTRRYVESRGGIVKTIRVGTAFFRNELQRDRSVLLGAESSGHFYYPEFFNSDAAVLTFIYVCNILSSRQARLSELSAPMMASFRSGEINMHVAHPRAVLERVQKYFSDGALSLVDGISVEYPEWRFTLRPSNTDPVIRLHIEADTKELLEEKRNVLEGLIQA